METTTTQITAGSFKTEREIRCEEFLEAISIAKLDDFYRVVVDAIPSPVLIMERDVRIVDYNNAAGCILDQDPQKVVRARIGDATHCMHSIESPLGCGHSLSCSQCVIRNAVNSSLNGSLVRHRKAKLELIGPDRAREATVLVTASPLEYDERRYVLLILEELSEEASKPGERESHVHAA